MKALVLVCTFTLTCLASAFESDIILDEADTASVELLPTGAWPLDNGTQSLSSDVRYRAAAAVTASSSSSGTETARFHTTLPDGLWQVWLWHTTSSGGAANARAVITLPGQVTSTINVDFRSYAGQWLLLGTYQFSETEEAQVTIQRNGSSGLMSADAVKFRSAMPDGMVDANNSSGFVMYTPSSSVWTIANDRSAFQGSVRVAGATAQSITMKWTPATGGEYDLEVYLPHLAGVWLPSGATAATQVPITITQDGENFPADPIPWSGAAEGAANAGTWIRVGSDSFRFVANEEIAVTLSTAGAGGTLAVDAVRFTKATAVSRLVDNAMPAGTPGTTRSGPWGDTGTTRSPQTWLYTKKVGFGRDWTRVIGTSGGWLSFRPSLTHPDFPAQWLPGRYDVWLTWAHLTTNSHVTKVETKQADGSWLLLGTIDQELFGGRWVHITNADLDPATFELRLSANGGSDYVVADAALFTLDPDSDGDDLEDLWEFRYVATLPTLSGGADYDGDGTTDGAEMAANTDPTDPAPVLTLTAPTYATLQP